MASEEIVVHEEDEDCLDFFAKKDKSKKTKKKSKAKTSDDIIETGGSELNAVAQHKDVWKDYDAETEKDYSSLKIADLQFVEEADTEASEDGGNDGENDGSSKKKQNDGVWDATAAASHAPTEAAAPPPSTSSTPNVSGGKYVPGAFRGNTMQPASSTRTRPGKIPDVTDQAAFPTLSDAAKVDTSAAASQGFQEVPATGRTWAQAREEAPRLNLSNRYEGHRR